MHCHEPDNSQQMEQCQGLQLHQQREAKRIRWEVLSCLETTGPVHAAVCLKYMHVLQGVGFLAGWRGSLGVRHAWSYGYMFAKLSDDPNDGSTWSGPAFFYLADSGAGGVGMPLLLPPERPQRSCRRRHALSSLEGLKICVFGSIFIPTSLLGGCNTHVASSMPSPSLKAARLVSSEAVSLVP